MSAGRRRALRSMFTLLHGIAQEKGYVNALEIGVHWGYSTIAILLGGTGHLRSIDIAHYSYIPEKVDDYGFTDRWTYIVEDSLTAMPKEKEAFYDFVFIDGAHDYSTVLSDLEHSVRILKPDGVLLADDYLHEKGGVGAAVDEIAERHNLSIRIHPANHEPIQTFGIAELRKSMGVATARQGI